MSEQSGEKTELPTQKRLRDAREKEGNVLFSREIVSVAVLMSVLAGLVFGHQVIVELVVGAVNQAIDGVQKPFEEAFPAILQSTAIFFLATSGIAYGMSLLAGTVSNLAQVGFMFTGAKIKKGLSSLNAIQNAKQMFSAKSFVTFLLNIMKVVLILTLAGWVIVSKMGDMLYSINCGFACASDVGIRVLTAMVALIGVSFIPVAVMDFLLQRHFHLKELMMTKDEVKREFKETEGSPEIKQQRRAIHQEMSMSSMMGRVSKSSVVVKNPTHYAVALLYQEAKTPLPLVVAKGEGALAQTILKQAERHGVPIYEEIDLAQRLFYDVDLDSYIGADHIDAVADVISTVMTLRRGD